MAHAKALRQQRAWCAAGQQEEAMCEDDRAEHELRDPGQLPDSTAAEPLRSLDLAKTGLGLSVSERETTEHSEPGSHDLTWV